MPSQRGGFVRVVLRREKPPPVGHLGHKRPARTHECSVTELSPM
jgi:hypothetical protein